MNSRRKPYPFDAIETKWQERWETENTYRAPNPGEEGFDASRPKYYVLDMFPYPSGQGLHVGHPEGYTATDILARAKRKQGYNVLHPMGWDAFGLPAEQYAIKTGQHPRVTTEQNVERFRAQLKRLGFAYDWSREINTTAPNYFRWTQWIFLQLYHSAYDPEQKKAVPIEALRQARRQSHPQESKSEREAYLDTQRLAYVDEVPVNWCPELGTVLANEEVVDGVSEVGGFPVERRPMRQWMLRITAFAERLIEGLENLDWPESIVALQRNWIGRSVGAEVVFALGEHALRVFTTRPDTLFGATYMVLAPEHPLVDEITTAQQREAVEEYCRKVASKSDLERAELAKEKTGVWTGATARNPVNGEEIPVWIADYVLMSYGTGGIMAVPAHDERDYAFAQTFGLPIREVVQPTGEKPEGCFVGEGVAINSPLIEGLPTAEAKEKITAWLEERELGSRAVNYKLRDWLFSRQRYWGEPFPIVWEEGRHRALPEDELPIMPPDLDDFKPTGTPEPPLSKAHDWVAYSESARRETNTMPQWAGSCWYYLRFCDPDNATSFASREAQEYWMGGEQPGGVDLYVGGTEHAVLHLLYARFWHQVLYDLGHVVAPEPFQRLVNQGLILGEDGQKMSKSIGNVVNPDDVVDQFGADSLRLFEMFMGPLEQVKPWSTRGVEGVHRFLARVWRLFMEADQEENWSLRSNIEEVALTPKQNRLLNETIKKVTLDTEGLSFNTAISQMMIFVNGFTQEEKLPREALATFLHLLAPYAPHLAEELWEKLRNRFADLPDALLSELPWPGYDEGALQLEEVEIVVQVNGKVRDRIELAVDLSKEEVEAQALASERVQKFVEGQTVRKVIVVPNKLVNIVAN